MFPDFDNMKVKVDLSLYSVQSFVNIGFLYDKCLLLLLFAFYLHLFIFRSHKSFSKSSSYLSWGIPISHLPSHTLSKIYLATPVCSFLVTHFNHFNFLLSISATRSGDLYNSISSWLVLILLTPYSITGLYNFLKMLHSHIFNIILSFSLVDHVLYPCITTGYNVPCA